MRDNHASDGECAEKIEAKYPRRMNMSYPRRKHFFRAGPCFLSRGHCSARHRSERNLKGSKTKDPRHSIQPQKWLLKGDRSLKFALCARRPASLSFFCLLYLGCLMSRALTRSRDEETILQPYHAAKRSGDLLGRRSFQSNRRGSGLVSCRVQG